MLFWEINPWCSVREKKREGELGGRVKRPHFPPHHDIHIHIKGDLWKVEGGHR